MSAMTKINERKPYYEKIIATLLVLVGTSAMVFAATTDCKAAKAPVETTADATAE